MFTLVILIRYMLYITMAILFHQIFVDKYPFLTPTFLINLGILAEVLDWKYNRGEE